MILQENKKICSSNKTLKRSKKVSGIQTQIFRKGSGDIKKATAFSALYSQRQFSKIGSDINKTQGSKILTSGRLSRSLL